MARKSKVPYELKIINIERYIKVQKSALELSNILGVSKEQFLEWVRKYNANGAESLKTCSKNKYYSLEIKQLAIHDYISEKNIRMKYAISTIFLHIVYFNSGF